MNEKEIRALLGLDDEADIGEAIRALQTTVVAQKAVIETDKPLAEKAEVAKLRGELLEARGKLIIEQTENARKITAIEEAARENRVEARVDRAIAMQGKPPRMREQMLEYGMMASPEKLDTFIDSIPSIDMTERGVATGHELAELEPTAAEMKTAAQMGVSRDDLIRQKAKNRGLELPAEAK